MNASCAALQLRKIAGQWTIANWGSRGISLHSKSYTMELSGVDAIVITQGGKIIETHPASNLPSGQSKDAPEVA